MERTLGIKKNGEEVMIYYDQTRLGSKSWYNITPLPKGSIKLLIGKELKPGDFPIEFNEIYYDSKNRNASRQRR